MYICVCMYVCVCEREIEREKSKNIIYYTISFTVHICFIIISNIIFTRKILVLQNLDFIYFFIFLKFSLVINLIFIFILFFLASNIMKWLL